MSRDVQRVAADRDVLPVVRLGALDGDLAQERAGRVELEHPRAVAGVVVRPEPARPRVRASPESSVTARVLGPAELLTVGPFAQRRDAGRCGGVGVGVGVAVGAGVSRADHRSRRRRGPLPRATSTSRVRGSATRRRRRAERAGRAACLPPRTRRAASRRPRPSARARTAPRRARPSAGRRRRPVPTASPQAQAATNRSPAPVVSIGVADVEALDRHRAAVDRRPRRRRRRARRRRSSRARRSSPRPPAAVPAPVSTSASRCSMNRPRGARGGAGEAAGERARVVVADAHVGARARRARRRAG